MNEEKELIKCPVCKGEGGWGGIWDLDPPVKCDLCNGRGDVTQKKRMEYVRSFIGLEEDLRRVICNELKINEASKE